MLIDTARSLNFGSLTNINLPGEMPGFIPDPESVRRMHQRDFAVAGGDTALTAIGQGDVLVTPLQMADFMAAIANNGTIYRPSPDQGHRGPQRQHREKLPGRNAPHRHLRRQVDARPQSGDDQRGR